MSSRFCWLIMPMLLITGSFSAILLPIVEKGVLKSSIVTEDVSISFNSVTLYHLQLCCLIPFRFALSSVIILSLNNFPLYVVIFSAVKSTYWY